MKRLETALPGVVILEPEVFSDHRGFFLESYSARVLRDLGITDEFVQDNRSRSVRHVLRGLHYQLGQPQAKLVTVTRGAVYDVAVDLRVGSPTFLRWVGVELSEDNKRLFYVPVGFAHGFYVQSEVAELQYKCSDYYSPADERGISWSDPDVAITWPNTAPPVLSARDAGLPVTRSLPPDQLFRDPRESR